MQVSGILGQTYGADPQTFILNFVASHKRAVQRSMKYASEIASRQSWTVTAGDGKKYTINLIPSLSATSPALALAWVGWGMMRPDALAQGMARAFSEEIATRLDGDHGIAEPYAGEPLTAAAIVTLIGGIVALLTAVGPIVLPFLIDLMGKAGDGLGDLAANLGLAPKPDAPAPTPTAPTKRKGDLEELLTNPWVLGAAALALFLILKD